MSSKTEAKTKEPHPLDAPRRVLHASSSIPELDRARAEAESVRQADEAAIAAKEAERANAACGDGSADEVDAKLEAIDREIAALKRRRDIAVATVAALDERLTTTREAEAQKAKREAYEKAEAGLKAYGPKEADFLERFTRELRVLLRERSLLSLAIRGVNRSLPEGAGPLADVDSLRLPRLAEPKVTVREFHVFMDEKGNWFAEEGVGIAKRRADGLYDVAIPDGTWRNGDQRVAYRTCSRVDWVEVTTSTPRLYYPPGPLPTEIAIPALRGGDPPGWSPLEMSLGGYPDTVLRELDRLESLPPGSGMSENVKTQRMPAEQWRSERQADKAA